MKAFPKLRNPMQQYFHIFYLHFIHILSKIKTSVNDVLYRPSVLVLNRSWLAIGVKSPAEAFSMLITGVASALDIDDHGGMEHLPWKSWRNLPVRLEDESVGTVSGRIRCPTVIVLTRYNKVPRYRASFSLRGLWERDRGVCQYTGRQLQPGEGNIDHVVPRSRGGTTCWENCVLADKKVNSKKADRLPHEAGLKLLRPPRQPRELPVTALIKNPNKVSAWRWFLTG